MPGVNFQAVRDAIPMQRVLELLDFEPSGRSGAELRGPCPIHGSSSARSRTFSANIEKHSYQCFKCGSSGNQLDLWAAYRKLPLFRAAVDLCEAAGVDVPYVERW